jgi:PAS domain S-box-containing protein
MRKVGPFAFACVGFFVLARLGALAGLTGQTGHPFWVASGFGLALALSGRRADLLGLACGSFLGGWAGLDAAPGLVVALSDTASAWLAAWLYRRICNSWPWLGVLREGLALSVAAVTVALLSALTAANALIWSYAVPDSVADEIRLTWFLADALGVIIAGPVCIILLEWVRRPVWPSWRTCLGLLGILLLTAVVALVVVMWPERKGFAFLFFLVPLVAGYWFGGRMGTLAVFFSVAALIFIVARYDVSLVNAGAATNRLVLAMFIGGLGVVSLVVAADSVEKLRGLPLAIYVSVAVIAARIFGMNELAERERQDLQLQQVVVAGTNLANAYANNLLEALRPTAFLLRENPQISSAKWKDYVDELKLTGNYDGLDGLGVVYPVAPEKLAEFRSQSRARGIRVDEWDDLTGRIAPSGGAEHKIIALWNWRTGDRPTGLDLAGFAPQCAAAETARDWGVPILVESLPERGGPGTLPKRRPSMLVLWPVYETLAAPTTVEARRQAFVCWLTAVLDSAGLAENILGKIAQPTELSVYVGTKIRPESLVISHVVEKVSKTSLIRSQTSSLVVLNRIFTLVWGCVLEDDARKHLQPMAGSLVIILAGAFLSSLVLSLRTTAHKVEREVVARTRELQLANLALVQERAQVLKLDQIAREAKTPMFLTGGDRKIEWVNQSFSDFYGYTIDEVFGKRMREVVGPGSGRDAFDHQWETFDETKAPVTFEILHTTKSGGKVWVSKSIRPILGPHGEIERIIGVITDLTAAKDYQHRLEAATAKAEQANLAKSNLLANVSHELRTPLNVIMGNLHLLQAGKFGRVEEGLRVPLQSVAVSSQYLLKLINDLLDVSKASAGRLTLEKGPVDVTRMVGGVVDFIRVSAEAKKINLTVELQHRTELIAGDELRLKQILINLLNNAVKFTSEGGTVTVRVEETAQPPELQIHVSDTGIGIHRDDHERIFLEFEQGEQVGHSVGTGLGLPIARRLAKMHDGDVTVVSAPGRGSTFTFRLPICRPSAPPPPPADSPPADSPPADPGLPGAQPVPAGALILAVDDYEVNLEILCMYLKGEGYRVIQATRGEAAIAQAQEHLPNLILMDVKMPGIDGLEAIRLLKADPKTRDIPVISLTAFAAESDTKRCLEAGAADYLSKPIDFAELGRKLTRHLASRASTREHALRSGDTPAGGGVTTDRKPDFPLADGNRARGLGTE